MRKLMLLFLVCILLLTFPLASAYYADVVVDIASTGEVSIQGVTDYEELLTTANQSYTSKNGAYWLLNITKDVLMEYGVVEIQLPPGAEVTYLKAPSVSRFAQERDRLVIISTLENQSFSFLVQYTILPTDKKNLSAIWVGFFTIIFAIFLAILIQKKASSKTPSYDLSLLPARQRVIMQLLMKHKGRMTQAELEKKLTLPKSSLSRNVDALVRKGLIQKTPSGMSNILQVKKD